MNDALRSSSPSVAMDRPGVALSGTSVADGSSGALYLGYVLEQLNLEDEEFDDLVIDEADPEINESVRWLALARVLTTKSFGQGALIADMKAAWNPARDVVWRRINSNLFSIHFNCLADWNKALHQGPWDFKGMALILAEYDCF